ncbi:putative N6-adenine-specific DNA methylase [Xenococcus sp. PCC 7305]|uniref:THUMP domain-containing class I SAM-dependent RNA methyltransferase n=1 Tax=Xenococcus sp. PCC 7305 TaxID=102125 RepID=UPI0002AC9CD2|nr:THUMP domain-containing protein [Xenococcus sp. PCC 7305]ELS02673.1 putative N6-adenine-specific DNA methylase [Xenococcus sp. PCC 7305]
MNDYFATVARGLEETAAQELIALGATEVKTDFLGVYFQGNQELLYRVNLWSRTIFRVLVKIDKVKSFDAQSLYKSVQTIDWSAYLNPEMTLAVTCTGKNKQLNHSHFTALQIKNAIVDQQQKQYNKRSDINAEAPDLLVNAHIDNNRCIISLDSSGSSLHRRGYRPAMGRAPLKETLAAALIQMTDWTPELAFFDPLCGSGTLPIEAAMQALNIAPGLYKSQFGFQTWLDYDETLWNKLVTEAKNSQLKTIDIPIIGSDRDFEIIDQAYTNAENCGLGEQIQFMQKELSEVQPPAEKGVIICNPPYGQRLGTTEELEDLYKMLGDIFKQRFKGWTAYILTGNKQLAKKVGLRTSQRIPVYNGSLACTLLKYELY